MAWSLPANRRRVVVVVLCLLALVVAVQLLDPFEADSPAPVGEPPAEDEPAELLRYSVAQLNTTSYTLTVYLNTSDGLVRHWYFETNQTERESYGEFGPWETGQPAMYYHSEGMWLKKRASSWEYGYGFNADRFFEVRVPRPYRSNFIRSEGTHIHNRTEDALWIQVDGNRQNDFSNHRPPGGTYTLYELDQETYRINRSIEYAADNHTVRQIYEFEDYGRTTVSRPEETKDPLINLLNDLRW